MWVGWGGGTGVGWVRRKKYSVEYGSDLGRERCAVGDVGRKICALGGGGGGAVQDRREGEVVGDGGGGGVL
jgi:hypothetical protein